MLGEPIAGWARHFSRRTGGRSAFHAGTLAARLANVKAPDALANTCGLE